MTALSTQAETGSANREAVAIALGWKKDPNGEWSRPHTGEWRTFCPDYQNDLPATLAEIERRGWAYSFGSTAGYYCAIFTAAFFGDAFEATGTTIAHAACAALLQALEQQP
jgi:hypothetical protein